VASVRDLEAQAVEEAGDRGTLGTVTLTKLWPDARLAGVGLRGSVERRRDETGHRREKREERFDRNLG
jgi:hypothetical protein